MLCSLLDMSETLYNSLHNVCGNSSCQKKLQVDISKCPNCLTPIKTKVCAQCFRYIPNFDTETVCPYPTCKHVDLNPPEYKPCVLCLAKLDVGNDTCKECKISQDYSVLQNMKFKVCCNSDCRFTARSNVITILPYSLMKCYNCGCDQSPWFFQNPPKVITFEELRTLIWAGTTQWSNILEHLKVSQQQAASCSIATNNSIAQVQMVTSYTAYCTQCFKPMPESADNSCPFCKHVQANHPKYIPCIICDKMLNVNASDKCVECGTQQDYSVLREMPFKMCSTFQCNGVMPFSLVKCCFCNQEQSELSDLSNIERIPFEKLLLLNRVKPALLDHIKSKSDKVSSYFESGMLDYLKLKVAIKPDGPSQSVSVKKKMEPVIGEATEIVDCSQIITSGQKAPSGKSSYDDGEFVHLDEASNLLKTTDALPVENTSKTHINDQPLQSNLALEWIFHQS